MTNMMGFQRTFLLILLAVISYMLWDAWVTENPPLPQQTVESTLANKQSLSDDVPSLGDDSVPAVSQKSLVPVDAQNTAIPGSRLVQVRTDVLNVTLDTLGGQVVKVELPAYPVSLQQSDTPVTMLQDKPGSIYIAQSGLKGPQGPDLLSGVAQFSVEKAEYALAQEDNELAVVMSWKNADGVRVNKTFIFKRGQYLIDIDYSIDNQSAAPWRGQLYAQLKRQRVESKRSSLLAFPTYTGGAISTPERRFHKVSFDDMSKENLDERAVNGWVAMVEHYFVSAFIPEDSTEYRYFSRTGNEHSYWLGMVGPWLDVEPGASAKQSMQLYVGPEITDTLKDIAPGLELTVDYGWFWPIAQGLFWLMKHIHQFVGNWGVVIIIITLLIKAVFYPLSAASYRSMANMRKLQPKITALKERYGDDKQKFSQAMMELYKKEKINPLGGCLPILVQIPVFIALYWVLIESVEFRQAPFFLWIKDLSVHDPYYVLPVIMGISMFAQQKLSPAPPDPIQAKVLMAMPIVFTVLFLSFPAGLMVYWVVNNLLSIAQQWSITKAIEGKK